ncbi:MAG: alpha/beta fold hydrolase [Actinocatenispora sp.]
MTYPVRQFRRFAWPEPGASFETPADHGLTPVPFRVVAADGLGIRCWRFTPRDPWGTVVVCHARGADKSRTLRLARLLYERDLEVVSFDFRGCGESDRPVRQWRGTLWDPLRDLDAVAAEAAKDTDRLALLGCSFGGNMVIAHGGTAPRRYAAVILDSTPVVRWVDMLDRQFALERRDARHPAVRAGVDRALSLVLAWWTRSNALYRHALRSVASEHMTPLMHIVGARESMFDVDESCRTLTEHCAGPLEVWRVPRGRHLTNHVVDPTGYADRVTSFLTTAFGRARKEST